MKKTENGKIEVFSNATYRWLCINDTVQTLMDISEPTRLVLPHLHALVMAFYIKPAPAHIIELGLGGGALPRHIIQHSPLTKVSSVELEPTIIACFRDFFYPDHAPPLHNIYQEDAYEFIKSRKEQSCAIIFIDLFGENAAPGFLSKDDFYHSCFKVLDESGLLVLNLLPNHPFQADQLRQMLGDITGHRPLLLTVPGYKNRIMFSSKQSTLPIRYTDALEQFSMARGIDLNSFMQVR